MFSCARVKDDLVLHINYKWTIGLLSSLFIGLVLMMWLIWYVGVKVEIIRFRKDLYSAVSVSLKDVIDDSFRKNHMSLLQLENCMARLTSCDATSKDMAKMLNSKNLLEVSAPQPTQKTK